MPSRSLLIIDGYSLLFRAFYATRYLSTSDGRPTNALFGFTGMIFSLIDQHKPDCILVALDSHKPTFRHIEYAEYKGTRKETPNELIEQLIYSRELLTALGIPQIELEGFEADDVVGTISLQAEQHGYRSYIVTGDLDALQLVDEFVTVITPKQGVNEVNVYDREAVIARYGFGPEYITDYKSLVGDTSDNIPGVPGIGEKSATKLILEFGSVENIVANLERVEEKFRKKLEPGLPQIPKSKWLATIVRNVPIEFDFAPYHLTVDQIEACNQMLLSLELKNLAKRAPVVLNRYTAAGAASELAGEAKLEVISEPIIAKIGDKINSLEDARRLIGDRKFAFVSSAPAPAANLLDDITSAESFIAVGDTAYSIPFDIAHQVILGCTGQAITHGSKAFYRGSGNLERPYMDTQLAGYVLQSGRQNYMLGDLIQGYLDAPIPSDLATMSVGLYKLNEVMRERLEKENQTHILDDLELPLVPILAEMEDWGISLSEQFLLDFSKSLAIEIGKLTATIQEQAGQEFLIASPKQLGEILFEKLGIPAGKKNKTGWATGAEVLQELVLEYPICGDVLSWRELTKLKSTYADSLPKMIKSDGRIHTSFNQTVAATGRLSSNDPNIQNIPIRTELGKQIRRAFVAAPGFELVSLDYSQIELRLLAHMCQDEALVNAFQTGIDVHTATAALMFNMDKDQVTKEQRRLAKMLNYAVLYGVTEYGLAQQLGAGFSISESKTLIMQYNERFAKVKGFIDSVVDSAKQKGFTTTLDGRRRYFPDIHAQNRNERMGAERQAMNAPIQGTAADLVKKAMIDVRKQLGNSDYRMLLQVHDELLFEIPIGRRDACENIRSLMENALPVSVPIEVDMKIGLNWNEMIAVARS